MNQHVDCKNLMFSTGFPRPRPNQPVPFRKVRRTVRSSKRKAMPAGPSSPMEVSMAMVPQNGWFFNGKSQSKMDDLGEAIDEMVNWWYMVTKPWNRWWISTEYGDQMVNHGKSMMVNRDDFSGAEYGDYIMVMNILPKSWLWLILVDWYYSTMSYPMNHICNTESTSPISISPSPSQHIMGGIPTIPSHASPSSFEVQYTIWVPLDSKVSL